KSYTTRYLLSSFPTVAGAFCSTASNRNNGRRHTVPIGIYSMPYTSMTTHFCRRTRHRQHHRPRLRLLPPEHRPLKSLPLQDGGREELSRNNNCQSTDPPAA